MSDRDIDAEFAAIVAGWDEPSTARRPVDDGASDSSVIDRPSVARDVASDEGGEDGLGSGANPANPVHPVTPANPVNPPYAAPAPAPPVSFSFPVWRGPTGPESSGVEGVDDDGEDEDDEGFVPPEVVLPPQEDLHYWGVVAGFAATPLLLLYVVVVQPFHKTWWLFAALASFIGAFVLLILRQPRHRDPEDTDNGARV